MLPFDRLRVNGQCQEALDVLYESESAASCQLERGETRGFKERESGGLGNNDRRDEGKEKQIHHDHKLEDLGKINDTKNRRSTHRCVVFHCAARHHAQAHSEKSYQNELNDGLLMVDRSHSTVPSPLILSHFTKIRKGYANRRFRATRYLGP